jgi:hypothetical protein
MGGYRFLLLPADKMRRFAAWYLVYKQWAEDKSDVVDEELIDLLRRKLR